MPQKKSFISPKSFNPWEYLDDIKFCEECGSELVYVGKVGAEEFNRAERFDEKTGERNMIRVKRCPNLRWWNSGAFGSVLFQLDHTETCYGEILKEKV